MNNPKVSVVIITYNHEKYIAQAIDSVLMQETDFDFEIIIGEDDSSDNTRIIVKEYKRQHPDRVRLLLNDRKNVIYINGQPTGRWNFVNSLKHARGDYVALLEGDDYWLDSRKLQLQVEALDNNSDCVLCFHNTLIRNEKDGSEITSNTEEPIKSTIHDVIDHWGIMTGSMLFRNHLLTTFPKWYYTLQCGESALQLLLASFGNIFYIDRIMSVYRRHPEGISQAFTTSSSRKDYVRLFRYFDKYADGKYREAISRRLAFLYLKLAKSERNRRNILMAVWYVLSAIYYQPPQNRGDWMEILRSILPLRLVVHLS